MTAASDPFRKSGRPDVVVVGGGTSGCVLAARLSEDPGRRVLLLEAGAAPRTASGFSADVLDGRTLRAAAPSAAANWDYPGSLFPGRSWGLARGRVLGGSSSVNGGYLVRPRREEVERWAEAGGAPWQWDAVLPLLRRLERDLDYGENALHGGRGPLPIRRASLAHPVHAAATEAARALGLPDEPDKNGQGAPGVGPVPIGVVGTRRISSAIAYLLPVLGRPNLAVRGGVVVARVLLERGAAVGVETVDRERIDADAVVLSAGSLASPAILLRSGIGPRRDLERLGVDLVRDAPGVGAAISDHPQLAIDWEPFGDVPSAVDSWMGPLLHRALSAATIGDLELIPSCVPVSRLLGGGAGPLSVLAGVHTPRRRGRLRLRSADPRRSAEIDLGYLADEEDRRALRIAARASVELLETAPLNRLVGRRLGPDVATLHDDAALNGWVAGHLSTSLHACGTVPFGADDGLAVVDGTGRMHGVPGLRVADTSILPTAPQRGPALSAFLIGELVASAMRNGS